MVHFAFMQRSNHVSIEATKCLMQMNRVEKVSRYYDERHVLESSDCCIPVLLPNASEGTPIDRAGFIKPAIIEMDSRNKSSWQPRSH